MGALITQDNEHSLALSRANWDVGSPYTKGELFIFTEGSIVFQSMSLLSIMPHLQGDTRKFPGN